MGAAKLFERLELARRLIPVNRKIDKQDLYIQAELSKCERRIFVDDVARAELSYLLTTDSINVRPYSDEEHLYEGIAVVTVYLNRDLHLRTYLAEKLPVIGKYREMPADDILLIRDKIAAAEALHNEFQQTRRQLEQETRFNRKVELNQKLYELKKRMESIRIF
ncbi:hypothetical protein SCACP_35190 [Sporomusa carbonis]|uniref:DUF4391 domain-containing protein n=1 Tax=Sporomusa carbonis TaxID=3076075 RepID=UPI003A611023